METKSSSRWSDYLVPLLIVIAFAILLFWWYQPAADLGGTRVQKITLEPFIMPPGEEGSLKTAADLKGKITFINFWATYCKPCRKELPQIGAIYDRFRQDPDIQIWTIVSDPQVDEHLKESVKKLLDENGVNLPVYVFAGPLEPESLVPQYIPAAMLVGPDGQVVSSWVGPQANLESQIETLVTELRKTMGKAAQNADAPAM